MKHFSYQDVYEPLKKTTTKASVCKKSPTFVLTTMNYNRTITEALANHLALLTIRR